MTFKELLKSKNMTQETLAAHLNIAQPTVSMWCTGKSFPHTSTLFRLAEILGEPVEIMVKCFKEQER